MALASGTLGASDPGQRWAHLERELIWNGNGTGTGTEKNQSPFLGPGAQGLAGTGKERGWNGQRMDWNGQITETAIPDPFR